MANATAAFVLNGSPTLWTGAKTHGVFRHRAICLSTDGLHVLADGLGNGIGAGQDLLRAKAGRFVTADTD